MLNQSTPILRRTKKAYLAYYEKLVAEREDYTENGLTHNANYWRTESEEALTMLRYLDRELDNRTDHD
jgi:hypothetical protein